MFNPICSECRHWHQMSECGECRAMPPQCRTLEAEPTSAVAYPVTPADFPACGQFVRRLKLHPGKESS